MRAAAATGLLLLTGAVCQAEDLEITGLTDFAGCRMVCVQHGREAATLRIGEDAFGYRLERVDGKEKTAMFSAGTNKVVLHLLSIAPSANPAATALVGVNRTPANRWRRPGAIPQFTGNDTTTDNEGSEAAQPAAGAGGIALWQGRAVGIPATSSNPNPAVRAQPSSALQPPGIPAIADGGQAAAGVPQISESLSGGNSEPISSDSASSSNEGNGNPQPARRTIRLDPSYEEGQQIRALYGQSAFLAWDLERGHRMLGLSH